MLDADQLVEILSNVRDQFVEAAESGLQNEIGTANASLGNIRYLGGQRDAVNMSFNRIFVEIAKLRED